MVHFLLCKWNEGMGVITAFLCRIIFGGDVDIFQLYMLLLIMIGIISIIIKRFTNFDQILGKIDKQVLSWGFVFISYIWALAQSVHFDLFNFEFWKYWLVSCISIMTSRALVLNSFNGEITQKTMVFKVVLYSAIAGIFMKMASIGWI